MKDTNELLCELNNKFDKLLELLSGGVSFVDKPPAVCNITFGDWLDEWYSTYKKPKGFRQSYLNEIRRYIDNYIKPELGDKLLTEINGILLQNYLNCLNVTSTRRKICLVINESLKKAYALQKISFNPFLSVEVVNNKATHYNALTFEAQNKLIENITLNKYRAYFVVACCTGLRVGEILALDYERDIDYSNRLINVNKSMDIRTGEIYNTPKTKNSIRVVPFGSYLDTYLQVLQKSDYTYNGIKTYFKKLFTKLDLNGYTLYSFRHTFVSLCYVAKIPVKVIQNFVGHSDVMLTLNTYTHVLKAGTSVLYDYIMALKNTMEI